MDNFFEIQYSDESSNDSFNDKQWGRRRRNDMVTGVGNSFMPEDLVGGSGRNPKPLNEGWDQGSRKHNKYKYGADSWSLSHPTVYLDGELLLKCVRDTKPNTRKGILLFKEKMRDAGRYVKTKYLQYLLFHVRKELAILGERGEVLRELLDYYDEVIEVAYRVMYKKDDVSGILKALKQKAELMGLSAGGVNVSVGATNVTTNHITNELNVSVGTKRLEDVMSKLPEGRRKALLESLGVKSLESKGIEAKKEVSIEAQAPLTIEMVDKTNE